MTDHADLIARLRARLSKHPGQITVDRDLIADIREAADALSRPVTIDLLWAARAAHECLETTNEWMARHVAGEAQINSAAAIHKTIFHRLEVLTAALGTPAAGPETYPGHDPAAGLPQPDTGQLRHECAGSGRHEHDGCSCSDAELLARSSAILPNGVELAGFQPGVFYNEDLRMTEMLLRDCFAVWHPWGPFKGHAVDVGYDEKGELVGIKIWDDVRKPSARSPEPAGGSEPSDYHERHQVMEMEQADREAAIRAEATAKERERCANLVIRERDMRPENHWPWRIFDALAAAIRGGSYD